MIFYIRGNLWWLRLLIARAFGSFDFRIGFRPNVRVRPRPSTLACLGVWNIFIRLYFIRLGIIW